MMMLISMRTAAERAGISYRHFGRLIYADSLKIVKINRNHFLLRNEFDLWLSRRKKAA